LARIGVKAEELSLYYDNGTVKAIGAKEKGLLEGV